MSGTHQPPGTQTTPQRITAREREAQALELKKAGASFRQIAAQLGYHDQSGAHKAVKRALDRIPAQAADEYRQVEIERLETLILGLWSEAKGGRWLAVDRVLNLIHEEVEILGLAAPKKVANTNAAGDDAPLVVQHTVDLSGLTDEELEALDRIATRLTRPDSD